MKLRIYLLVMAVGFASQVATAIATPPDSASAGTAPRVEVDSGGAFDEGAQKRHYGAWLVRWFTEPVVDQFKPYHHPENPFTPIRDEFAPLPDIEPWPIDAKRGLLANDIRNGAGSLAWVLEGQTVALDPPPANMDWMSIALYDWDDPAAIRPVMCIPEACYFTSSTVGPKKGRVVIRKPGIWIALRKHNGKDVLAGILIHKTAPKNPLEDKLFKKWVAELGTRFPLPLP